MAAAMRGHVARGAVAGIVTLVARGEDVQAEAFGLADLDCGAQMRRDSIVRIASMTKPMLAVVALTLVEEGRIGLDVSVERWLPELAGREVLRSIEGPLDDTVPARRAITLRDLLTLRLGLGAIMAPPGHYPIQQAMAEAGIAPGPQNPVVTPDEWLRQFASLPLAHQPGEVWMYHTGFDVLAVLLARVAGTSLDDLMQERLFGPLGMVDTGFHVPPGKIGRLASAYARDAETGRLALFDPAAGGAYAGRQAFPCEVVSTADDVLAFARMLLACGRHGARRILSRPTVEQMTRDQITPEQKANSPFFPGFWDRTGWGFGVGIMTKPDHLSAVPGRYGWEGGFGTSLNIDPRQALITIFLSQRLMQGPDDDAINQEFQRLAYAAVAD
ncbi:class A beta-lactamase-related serine hydrolase [Bosea caraganae]|uniref:Class A beta-lactamase-related serine hydrolase n=2 Tax=Bosea caraganae TaxID=2763117 RepID=A0A370L8P3_9HYPH|nr:class A beta-lactamase-related serine hydrolase [Bosea caraganae]RDJ30655.1 class A beta-lactamase-related serine hydrolase [Bosea caraganae]